MKQVLFTVIGSFMLSAGAIASGNPLVKPSATIIVKPAPAQSNFTFFRAHHQNNGVGLQWGMDGAGATTFYISRTYEFDPYDPNAVWEDVTVVNAGNARTTHSCNNARMYRVSDKSVFPGIITYRIVAVMTDGSSVTSEFKSVRVRKN